MANRSRSKRRRAGNAGGQAYTAGRGRPTNSGTGGAPLDPDELVFGNADQLREMAAELRKGGRRSNSRAAVNSRGRIEAFKRDHPDADPARLVGRPICGGSGPRPEAAPPKVRVAVSGQGNAELWIDDFIEAPNMWGEGISARMVREALDEIGGRDVTVHMNSGGGDYFEGVAIYQALNQHPGAVYVAVDALAASAASVIAMAGDTVGIGPGAFIMIHNASGFAYGNAEDMVAMADMLDRVDAQIAGFYARKTGTDAKEWRTRMAAELWADTEEALALGLADESLDPPEADPDAIPDPDEDEPLDDVAARAFPTIAAARARASANTPAPQPDPEPDVDWSELFRRDAMEELTA